MTPAECGGLSFRKGGLLCLARLFWSGLRRDLPLLAAREGARRGNFSVFGGIVGGKEG